MSIKNLIREGIRKRTEGVETTNESQAQVKYEAATKRANAAIEKISKKLTKSGKVNWADTGTMNKVAADLEEIVRFLG